MPDLKADDLSVLTVDEILLLVSETLVIPRSIRKRKNPLINYVIENSTPALSEAIQDAIQAKLSKRRRDTKHRLAERKRKRAEDQHSRRTTRRLEEALDDVRDTSKFLELPSEEQVKSCYRQFYEATSNTALAMAVCGVCARELSVKDSCVRTHRLINLPHTDRLIPKKPHPEHDLFEGKLLEPEGVVGDLRGKETKIRVCGECLADLTSDSAGDKPPRFSLANNMWIGRVPWQLQTLTFPEQLLIALLYPRVFVFKLFPKDTNYRPDASTLQRGLRGTVSTYDLDMEGAASMIQGRLVPRPTSVLPSIISITFIGRGDLSKHRLKSIFRVRRYFVAEALQWLKIHNPKYYGNIEIDLDRIRQLPDDDVPDEILGVVRQTTDVGLVDRESAGYVPLENDLTGTFFRLPYYV